MIPRGFGGGQHPATTSSAAAAAGLSSDHLRMMGSSSPGSGSAVGGGASMQMTQVHPNFASNIAHPNTINVVGGHQRPPLPIKKKNKRKYSSSSSSSEDEQFKAFSTLASLQDTSSEKKKRAVAKTKSQHSKNSTLEDIPPSNVPPAVKAWQLLPKLTATAVNLIELNKIKNATLAEQARHQVAAASRGNPPQAQPQISFPTVPWTEEMSVLELLGKVTLERRRQKEEADRQAEETALAAAKASIIGGGKSDRAAIALQEGGAGAVLPQQLPPSLQYHNALQSNHAGTGFPPGITTLPASIGGLPSTTMGPGQLKAPPPSQPPQMQYPGGGGSTTVGGYIADLHNQANVLPQEQGLFPHQLSQLLLGILRSTNNNLQQNQNPTLAFPPSPNVAAQLSGGRSFDELRLIIQRLIQQQQQNNQG